MTRSFQEEPGGELGPLAEPVSMAGHYRLWKHQTRSCKWLQARSSTSLRLIFLSPPLPILLPHNSSAGLHAEARNPLDRSADTASPDSPGAKLQPDRRNSQKRQLSRVLRFFLQFPNNQHGVVGPRRETAGLFILN